MVAYIPYWEFTDAEIFVKTEHNQHGNSNKGVFSFAEWINFRGDCLFF